MESEWTRAPIGNYYGTLYVFEAEGRYFCGIEDYDGPGQVEVSEAFYRAFLDEFGGREDDEPTD